MSIFDDNTLKSLENTAVTKLLEDYDKFYMVTYEIDQAFMISKIHVWMPNPNDNKAYPVDDLTKFIDNSYVDFGNIDTTVLVNDKMDYDFYSPASIYEIYHENELDKEKTDDAYEIYHKDELDIEKTDDHNEN